MTKYISGILCFFVLFIALDMTTVEAAPQQREGIAYDNVLMEGWSCIFPWVPDRGVEKYRRRIVNIQINNNGAFVVYANGSKRPLDGIAIINNKNTNRGNDKRWNIARNNSKDTFVLMNGDIIHAVITGYQNHRYITREYQPIHRDNIRFIYPNPNIYASQRY
jgi:hypothetical protein